MMVAVLRLHLHLHFHHFRGAPIDYVGLAAGAVASWIAGVGPGEPLLIAAALFAAKHKLDLTEVVLVAWAGANVGGIIGWIVGLKAGRALVTAPGPFRHARLRVLARGEKIFERRALIAVILTPSWLAGIHRVRWPVYLPANALSAAIWAVGIGVGAFLIGPPVEDLFDDVGTVGLAVLAAAIAAGGVVEIVRRRSRAD